MIVPVSVRNPELAPILHNILRLAYAALPFDRGAVYLIEGQALASRPVASWPTPAAESPAPASPLTLDEGTHLQVVQQGKPFLRHGEGSKEASEPSLLLLPLLWEGSVRGVLLMTSRSPQFFQPPQLALAEIVADQLALALCVALFNSSDQLAALLDATESGVLLSDGQGRIAHVNRVLCEILGMGREALLHGPVRELMQQASSRFSDPDAFQRRSDWLYSHPLAVVRDDVATAASPARLYLRYSAPIRASGASDDATPPGRIEVYNEVTERRALAAHTQQYLEDMPPLHRSDAAMGNEQDVPRLLHFICDQAAAVVAGSGAAVGLLADERPEQLTIVALSGGNGVPSEPRIERVDQSIAGDAIRQRQPVSISASPEEPIGMRLAQEWQAASALVLPLVLHETVLGALMVFRDETRPFDSHDLQLLQLFASQAALTIENARLLAVSQRRSAALESLTDYNDLLIDSSPVGIAVLGLDGYFTRANPAFRAIVDPNGQRVEGATLAQLFPQVEQTDIVRLIQESVQHEEPRYAHALLYPHLPRGPVWLDLSFTPLRGNGKVSGVVLTLTDITQRKQLEEDLRQRNIRINRQLTQHRALYEMGTKINAELEARQVLDTLMESIHAILGVDGLLFLLPNDTSGSFERAGSLGLSEEYLAAEARYHPRAGVKAAVEQRAPVLVAEIARDARMRPLRDAAAREGLASALFLPFVYRDEVVALMTLYYRQPYRYSLEEMELLSIFANQATAAIKNAQLYASITQSRSNLNAILQSMTDGVIALDNQDRVIFVNDTMFALLGVAPDYSWIGRTSDELWPYLKQLWRRNSGPAPLSKELGQSAGAVSVEVEMSNPARTIELVHAPIVDREGASVGRLLLLHDITQLRTSERMKDELISVLSHELRTPLTSILGYSKLLVDRPNTPDEKRHRWATLILEKSRLLNQLVNEVLDLSRLNMQRFDIHVEPHDLAALVQGTAAEYQTLSHQCAIVVDVQDDLGLVPFDRDRIGQLLTNLVVNAIKYSPNGGTVTLHARRAGDWVYLAVADEGLGIAPEFHERIFDPFFRVDNSTTREVYGTGLGLPLCKGIAQAHGGDIRVESELGKGSTFHVRLPFHPPSPLPTA